MTRHRISSGESIENVRPQLGQISRLYAKGIKSDSHFIERALNSIRDFMEDDGLESVYLDLIAPASGRVSFAKALNRSVAGSMNDLIHCATAWLVEDELSPHDVGFKLNEIPFSSLKYANPKETFKAMHIEQPAKESDQA